MNWGKFWQISIKNKVYLIFGCTQIFQKVFLCMNIRYHIIGVLLTRLCVFTSKYWGKYSINFVLNDCLNYSAEDMTCLYFQKLKKLCQYNYVNTTILYQFMIIFVSFWEQILVKNINKNCVFLPIFTYFGKNTTSSRRKSGWICYFTHIQAIHVK